MKVKILTVLVFLFVSFYACDNKQSKENTVTNTSTLNNKTNRLEILDFHTAHRCKACISIEANTKETLKKHFSNEMKSGKLSFRLINADIKENEKIVEEYGAYGTSLFLNLIIDGKEKHIDLTNFAFKKESNKEVFISELKAKIEAELKNL